MGLGIVKIMVIMIGVVGKPQLWELTRGKLKSTKLTPRSSIARLELRLCRKLKGETSERQCEPVMFVCNVMRC